MFISVLCALYRTKHLLNFYCSGSAEAGWSDGDPGGGGEGQPDTRPHREGRHINTIMDYTNNQSWAKKNDQARVLSP